MQTAAMSIISKSATRLVLAASSSMALKQISLLTLETAQASTTFNLTIDLTGSTITNFSSTGILDQATSTVVTISNAGNVGIGTTTPAVTLDLSGKTDAIRMPAGTTAQRPGTPANGDIRVNTTNGSIEAYLSSAWMDLTNAIMKRANITSTPYTITSTNGGYYLSYNNAAAGTINLPALSGLADGWSVTVVRKVAQSVTLTPNGADTFDNGLATLEMRGQNIKSITLMNNGGSWSIVNKTDDCIVGQSCWGAGNIYVGTNNGSQYFTTPGNCVAGSPYTCNGATDTVTRAWATTAPESTNLLGMSNYTDGRAQTATLAGYATAQAAQFCNNINSTGGYGGYTDWYLPAKQELSFLYQQSQNVPGFVYSVNYWSSTEVNSPNAWNFIFSVGYGSSNGKTNAFYVRCVRRF